MANGVFYLFISVSDCIPGVFTSKLFVTPLRLLCGLYSDSSIWIARVTCHSLISEYRYECLQRDGLNVYNTASNMLYENSNTNSVRDVFYFKWLK